MSGAKPGIQGSDSEVEEEVEPIAERHTAQHYRPLQVSVQSSPCPTATFITEIANLHPRLSAKCLLHLDGLRLTVVVNIRSVNCISISSLRLFVTG
jgi:hypothetical protein